MNLELIDKIIIITGGTRGIGKATADFFLKEGAKVIILARNQNLLNEVLEDFDSKYGEGKIIGYAVDSSNAEEMERVRTKIISQYGRIDGLIANVGDGAGSQEKVPNEIDWQVSWQQNFDTAIVATRVFLQLVEDSNGCIVYVSSIAGISVIGAPLSYSIAKTAIISLAKNLAVRVAPKARINVVAPGNIIFPGGAWEKKINEDPGGVNALINRCVPMRRFGEPHEIAQVIAFLCSTRASFITGAVVPVDGGQVLRDSNE